MKSFSQFIFESSDAATRARALGYESDGKGSWGRYINGVWEFMAKSITDPRTGKSLKFFNKGTKPGKRDRIQTDNETKQSYTTYAPVFASYDYGTGEYEQELREKYINNEIFAVNDWVKCNISEKVGKNYSQRNKLSYLCY